MLRWPYRLVRKIVDSDRKHPLGRWRHYADFGRKPFEVAERTAARDRIARVRIAQYQTAWSEEPLAIALLHDIDHIDATNDRASGQVGWVWTLKAHVAPYEGAGVVVFIPRHSFGRMDGLATSHNKPVVRRLPAPVLDIFAGVNDGPRPRLAN